MLINTTFLEDSFLIKRQSREEVLLSGAQGLFERQRVALHAALPLNNSSDS